VDSSRLHVPPDHPQSVNGHQTQVLASRTDAGPAVIAHAMFSRWRQENFFRYQRMRFDLDGLDAYTTVPDDPDRMVPNPAKKTSGPAGQGLEGRDRAGPGLPRPAHPRRRARSRA
jgi:hypothetical protein